MSGRITCCFLAAMICMGSSAWAQDPRSIRTSLVINEIMLNPKGGSCLWIEILNPTDHTIDLDGFSVSLDSREYVRFPSSTRTALDSGHVRLITIETPGCDPGLHRGAMSVPERAVTRWSSQGAISLRRQANASLPLGEGSLVDYVAWGQPPSSNPIEQSELWSPAAFVPLEETLGIIPQGVEIQEGWSIGLYPRQTSFGPTQWVVFDEHEVTPGWRNRVPRPKAFTLPIGARVGGRSAAMTWLRRSGDESYRFRLYRLPDTTTPIIDTPCHAAAIRIGDHLPDADYLYTVVAMAAGFPSFESEARTFSAVQTPCDWPLPPDPELEDPSNSLAAWLLGPSCPETLGCGLLPSIRFKFQRKDSLLRCETCEKAEEAGCAYNGIHPHCINVVFASGRPTAYLCAGGSISPTCRHAALNINIMNPDRALSTIRAGAANTFATAFASPTIESCEHGDNYCAFAALSMVASVYGKCLSQDWIANQLCIMDGDQVCCDLKHDTGVHNSDANSLFAWTLGIPEGAILENPSNSRWNIVHPPPRTEPLAAHFEPTYPPTLKFDVVKYWIDSNRPIMGRQGGHFHAVSGYCEEPPPDNDGPSRKWLYVFDSSKGPIAQPFYEWLKETASSPGNPESIQKAKGVWVGPPSSWSGVQKDDPTIWKDDDGNGLCDYDEMRP